MARISERCAVVAGSLRARGKFIISVPVGRVVVNYAKTLNMHDDAAVCHDAITAGVHLSACLCRRIWATSANV